MLVFRNKAARGCARLTRLFSIHNGSTPNIPTNASALRVSASIFLECLPDRVIRRPRHSAITRGQRRGCSHRKSVTPLVCLPRTSALGCSTRIYKWPVGVTTVYGLSTRAMGIELIRSVMAKRHRHRALGPQTRLANPRRDRLDRDTLHPLPFDRRDKRVLRAIPPLRVGKGAMEVGLEGEMETGTQSGNR